MEALATKATNRVAAIFLSLLAVGCGGGGSGGETNAALPVAIDLKISKSETYQNDSVELTWSSSSGASCSGSGDWGGSKSANGTETVEASAVGEYSFTLACSRSSNSATQTVELLVLEELQIGYSDFRVELSEDDSKEFDVASATTNREPLTPLAYTVNKGPSYGTIVLNEGIAVYEAQANFFGEDTIEISVFGENQTAIASVTIAVTAVNDPPSLNVEYPSLYSSDAHALILSGTTLDFPYSVSDPDTSMGELTIFVTINGEVFPLEVLEDVLRVSLGENFYAGLKSFNFSVSDGISEASSRLELWLLRNLSDSSSGPRVNQLLGNIEDPLRDFNYLVVFDDIAPGAIRNAGYEALTYYIGGFLADFDSRRQGLINATFNVYVIDFPAGISSGLNINTGCYDASPETYCAEEAQESANELISGLTEFSNVTIDAISIITGLDGRGVNLGTVNVQPLLGVADGSFAGPNRLLKTLKHEFGHAFQSLGDHYTSDYLLEDDAGQKLIDMSDGIETLDAYSVDISLEENPTAVKWRHHFNEDGSIPGLDSQVGEDARSIGYWSGCYYHAERCFRSSYNSIMNNLGVYAEELAFDLDRTQFDHVKFDDVGAEAFALAVLQQQGINSIDVELDENGDLLVGHKLQIPSTLFAIDWYIDGVRVEDWATVSATKLGGADLNDEDGNPLVERIRVSKKGPGESSNVAYRARALSSTPLIVVKDEIDTYGDVYLGSLSSQSGLWVCNQNNTSWAGAETTYCHSTLTIRFSDGWHYSPDWNNKLELLEQRADDIYFYYEDSGLGSQFFINWGFYQ